MSRTNTISEADITLLGGFLTNASGSTDISKIEFLEPDFGEYSGPNTSKKDIQRFKRLFSTKNKSVCGNCRQVQSECTCSTPEIFQTAFYINKDRLVKEWLEDVKKIDVFTDVEKVEKNGDTYVFASTDQAEKIRFRLIFNLKDLKEYSANKTSLNFPIGFVTSSYTLDNDSVFSWAEFLKDDFPSDINSLLSGILDPITKRICSTDNAIVSDNLDQIIEDVSIYFKKSGFEPEDEPEKICSNARSYIDVGKVELALEDKSSNSILMLCQCDHKPNTLHMHHLSGSELHQVGEYPQPSDLREKLVKKITKKRKIIENKQSIGKASAILVAVLGIVNLGPVAKAMGFIGAGDLIQSDAFAFAQTILTVLLVVVVLSVILYPFLQGILFDWELQPYSE
ncbi:MULTISPECIES: hypothetical protein [unclassified Haloferax]|uniref:hypothetical protein n=1 Tax=unclassified Haloferax TaxID=2625095 RepID=UPI0011C0195D|nr:MULTISPECIES: hypothetical protein [unclassified Haloferax]